MMHRVMVMARLATPVWVVFGMAFAVPVALPVTAAAQDIVFSPQDTADCVASGQPFEGCIGAAAETCMERNGSATVVMSACYDKEAQWWDSRLNAIYSDVMAQARDMDTENGEHAPSQADALRRMQRAWIDYRDETCSYEASQWGGGTGAGPAFNACLMRMTAEQSHYLETATLN
ncbi:lysozyme inhibitor LprI family protein [Sagittula stellata]|uniref:Lysozyme inhibitor LprI-like N-terminal domain-containing protein n=1 Tax=Sagittula stellata (strain ATCC 700073 / DSM 11524 / E-37) TaxID=388399 RepID=A3K1B0_SAGS3|nr:lysozyme inhibitor LprI family protein [Sagittula stellata]EBA08706.1 hypothetical protein SSE37_03650 [Sagittula stellata E-37]